MLKNKPFGWYNAKAIPGVNKNGPRVVRVPQRTREAEKAQRFLCVVSASSVLCGKTFVHNSLTLAPQEMLKVLFNSNGSNEAFIAVAHADAVYAAADVAGQRNGLRAASACVRDVPGKH